MQVFLNEQCKDAMNIMDFVNTFKLEFSDLEKVGEIGYVEGMSNIIIQKNNTNIDYPIRNLDLHKYFNKASPFIHKSKYDLIGVNIHLGSINKGHYISYLKNTFNDNWFCYNDSQEPILIQEPDELLDRNAYLLFYYRHN
jgi:ubiquitin C-terminal hydrolase